MSECKHLRRTYRCDIEECADCQMTLSDILREEINNLEEEKAKLKQKNERLTRLLNTAMEFADVESDSYTLDDIKEYTNLQEEYTNLEEEYYKAVESE